MVSATNAGIKISVETDYHEKQSKPELLYFAFAYRIKIENLTQHTIQIMRREWFIFDSNATVREVEGEGVVGEQPIIKPGEHYTYVSGCGLETEFGKMHGRYLVYRDVDDAEFLVDIPAFNLIVPYRLN